MPFSIPLTLSPSTLGELIICFPPINQAYRSQELFGEAEKFSLQYIWASPSIYIFEDFSPSAPVLQAAETQNAHENIQQSTSFG